MLNTKWTQWHFLAFFLIMCCLYILSFFIFSYPTSLLLIYYGFWLCAFKGFLCMAMHVSLCLYAFLVPFLWLSIFLFASLLCPLNFLFYFIIIFSFLVTCLFTNEREHEKVWIWVGGEDEVERIWTDVEEGNYNQNMLYKKLFSNKNLK